MLVVILISLLIFGCEILHAEESLNVKFDRSDKLIDRNQRDFLSFYNQIKVASKLDSKCDLSGCASSADNKVCKGFCEENKHLMKQALTASLKCLNTTPCSQKQNQWQLSNVQLPLKVEGYDGKCTLSGNQVTVSGENDGDIRKVYIIESDKKSLPTYKIHLFFTLTYEGLSVKCSPNYN